MKWELVIRAKQGVDGTESGAITGKALPVYVLSIFGDTIVHARTRTCIHAHARAHMLTKKRRVVDYDLIIALMYDVLFWSMGQVQPDEICKLNYPVYIYVRTLDAGE